MSSHRPVHGQEPGATFPTAVAQWRLQLRTEVKNASALPTAIFHSRDAMLETLLAEANETMLAQLHEPGAQVTAAPAAGEQRIEVVRADELKALPARLRETVPGAVDVDDRLAEERFAVLVDAIGSGHEAAAAGAIALLRRDCGIDDDVPGPIAAAAVRAVLDAALARGGPVATALAPWCERLAAVVATTPVATANP